MKVLLTSDTHYGYSNKTHRRHERFLKEIAKRIEDRDVDVVIHAGDWATNRQDQLERTLKMFRAYINVPILCVKGNHDFWDQKKGGKNMQRKTMYGELIRQHKDWFESNDIHYLGNSEFVKDSVCFVGFDGWYGYLDKARSGTNDAKYIVSSIESCDAHLYLANKAYYDLDRLLQKDYSSFRKTVCISHFPTFSRDWKGQGFSANFNYHEPMKDKFDVLCFGHSHMRVEREEDGTWIYNCGSDYDTPRYLIFEV